MPLTTFLTILLITRLPTPSTESPLSPLPRSHMDKMFPIEGGLLILTDSTFPYAETVYDFLFVFFTADWCSMCTSTLSQMKTVLPSLKSEFPNIGFAKIEATFYREHYLKYGANGYPTILLLSKGNKVAEYSGMKTFKSIAQWLNEKVLPYIINISTLDEFYKIKNSPLNMPIVVYFGSDFTELNELEKYSIDNIKRFRFVKVKNKDLIEKMHHTERTLTLYKSFDEPEVSMHANETHPFTMEMYDMFLNTYAHKMIMNYDRYAQEYVFSQMHSSMIFLYDKDSMQGMESVIHDVAIVTRDKIQIVNAFVNITRATNELKKHMKITSFPHVVLVNFKHDDPCFFDISDVSIISNANKLIEFVNNWYEGNVNFTNCKEIPEEYQKPIKQVNELQYNKEVIQSKQNVFVKFYAPWCGHCKKLEPVYKKLQKEMARDGKNLLFVEVDGTVNKIPGVVIKGYPTLLFYKAGDKEHPIEYNGNLRLEDMKKFLIGHMRK